MSEIPPTVIELNNFLKTATAKGWIGPTSGNAMMSTLRRVGPVFDEAEAADVEAINVNAVIRRFANLNRDVAASSLQSYTSRITSAIRMFSEWRKDPTTWRPRGGNGAPGAPKKASSRSSKKTSDDAEGDAAPAIDGLGTGEAVGLSYPFPLRDGVIVKLVGLPRDLTEKDVERISRFLRVLCVD